METIQIENAQTGQPIKIEKLKKVAQTILSVLGCPDSEISILIVDDARIQELNRDYLQRDNPTNVISFSMIEGEGGTLQPQLLGDVVISADTAARDALEASTTFESELYFLLLHGILHLLGYDHERGTAEDAVKMEAMELEIFAVIERDCLQAV
jgi:probable rRNA maturation factor